MRGWLDYLNAEIGIPPTWLSHSLQLNELLISSPILNYGNTKLASLPRGACVFPILRR